MILVFLNSLDRATHDASSFRCCTIPQLPSLFALVARCPRETVKSRKLTGIQEDDRSGQARSTACGFETKRIFLPIRSLDCRYLLARKHHASPPGKRQM